MFMIAQYDEYMKVRMESTRKTENIIRLITQFIYKLTNRFTRI